MKLIALAVIAAGTVAALASEVPQGAIFEVEQADADTLIAQGLAQAADTATPAATPPKTSKPKAMRVRLLMDCAHGKCNDVVTLSGAEAKAAEANGVADSTEESVAYALTLEQNQA